MSIKSLLPSKERSLRTGVLLFMSVFVSIASSHGSAFADQCGIFQYVLTADGIVVQAKTAEGLGASVLMTGKVRLESMSAVFPETTSAVFTDASGAEATAKYVLNPGGYSNVIINYSIPSLVDCALECPSDDRGCGCSIPNYAGSLGSSLLFQGDQQLLLTLPDLAGSWFEVQRGSSVAVRCGDSSSPDGVPFLSTENLEFVQASLPPPFACGENEVCVPPLLTLYSGDWAFATGDGTVETARAPKNLQRVSKLLRTAVRTRSTSARRAALRQALVLLKRAGSPAGQVGIQTSRSIARSVRLIQQAQKGGKRSTSWIAQALRVLK